MKLKKQVKFVLIGIICLITILVIILLLGKSNSENAGNDSKNNSNKELKGEKLISGLYKYVTKEKESLQINVIGSNIYYLTNDEKTYKLNELNIYTNETKEIGTIKDSICFLSDYLTCEKDGKIEFIKLKNLKL